MSEQSNTSNSSAVSWQSLEFACWICIAVHFIAGACMALVLSQGLESNPDLAMRCAFIAGNRGVWIAAWVTWNFAALSFVYFASCFSGAHSANVSDVNKNLLRYGLCLACAAIACDLSAESIEMGLIPQLAEAVVKNGEVAAPAFLHFHRLVVLLTGFAANGLYTSTVVLFALASRRHYASWVFFCAVATALSGLGISVTCLIESVAGMLVTNALCVPLLLLWLSGITFDARSRVTRSDHD